MAMILNLVPVVSILFGCKSRVYRAHSLIQVTTSIGAALWAADIESKRSTNPVEAVSQGVRGQDDGDNVEVTVASEGKKEL